MVGLEVPASGRGTLELKPYAISEVAGTRSGGDSIVNDATGDLGFDVKYGVTQNLVADLSVNTDFAQVEADEQQVNLTRFSLFFPEKREFFLENQGTFAFGGARSSGARGGGTDTPVLFYSREIGLDRGREIPMDVGGRLTGRIGKFTVGFMYVQTGAIDEIGVRGTNFTVARVRRDILRRSNIGLLYTGRSVSKSGAGSSATYGVDGVFSFYDDLNVNTYWAKTPRTQDGQPDLQGIWANNVATPLERPEELAEQDALTDEELAGLKARAARLFDGQGDAAFGDSVFKAALVAADDFTSTDVATGNYNQFWLAERNFDRRTSLIVDPPNGRIPALTKDGQARVAARTEARLRHAVGPEDRALTERCISFGVPRLGAGYNSYYQILQTPGYVVIRMETIHDVRVIPLDGTPHFSDGVRQWHGDSRGHWESDTLVVDTTNFSPKSTFREFNGSAENLHTIERFTRVGPDTLQYEVTVDDPTAWTAPWTVMIPLQQSPDQIYEFACHEGNIGMHGILAGARALEKTEAEEAATGEPR